MTLRRSIVMNENFLKGWIRNSKSLRTPWEVGKVWLIERVAVFPWMFVNYYVGLLWSVVFYFVNKKFLNKKGGATWKLLRLLCIWFFNCVYSILSIKRNNPNQSRVKTQWKGFGLCSSGGSGGNRTHVLLGCQKTFYILSLSFFLNQQARVNTFSFTQKAYFPLKNTFRFFKEFPVYLTPRPQPTGKLGATFRYKTKLRCKSVCIIICI